MKEQIRNFCIIAHIDHGKSTLADRLIQSSGIVPEREFMNQILDTMDIERERGITIKSQTIRLPFRTKTNKKYILNLIDTPGHVDFTYEVSRAMAACEGAILVIDATQGVEAQTVANLYLAMDEGLRIIPVINKIDLPSADVEAVKEQILLDLDLDSDDAVSVSAKEGIGIDKLIESIIEKIPPPGGDPSAPLKALVFDAYYDPYQGVVVYFRVFDGTIRPGDRIRLLSNNAEYLVEEVGILQLKRVKRDELTAGEVGYLTAGIKSIQDIRSGDTITNAENPAPKPLPGFREPKPVVFSSLYPVSSDDFLALSEALDKLKLNDASLVYEQDSSAALGFGFRCGFLGLLHMEVVVERLKREFDLDLITTAPSVRYRIELKDGNKIEIDNPVHFPDPVKIEKTFEPYIRAIIMIPDRYMGGVMNLCIDRRGTCVNYQYFSTGRMEMIFEMPLAEVIFDFYDRLKTITQGYGSFDYEIIDYRETDLVKLDILINGERVDALSQLVFRDKAEARARAACKRLKQEIPRHLFKIAIQGAVGAKIIARETISAYRKDVTAKCYGGDVTRKRKLLEKQKKGKKRMMAAGDVNIPQSAFLAVLKTDSD